MKFVAVILLKSLWNYAFKETRFRLVFFVSEISTCVKKFVYFLSNWPHFFTIFPLTLNSVLYLLNLVISSRISPIPRYRIFTHLFSTFILLDPMQPFNFFASIKTSALHRNLTVFSSCSITLLTLSLFSHLILLITIIYW